MYYNRHMPANPSQPAQSRADGLVTVQLGPELKTNWVKWCEARGLVPGKALRTLVEKALADGLELSANNQSSRVKVKILAGPDHGPKVGREIYFTPSEDAAIKAVASAQGFGFHEWVIAALRATLTNAPSYGQQEIEALTQSNAALLNVARELSLMRQGEGDALVAARIQKAEDSVKMHIESTSITMARGARRWQLKI